MLLVTNARPDFGHAGGSLPGRGRPRAVPFAALSVAARPSLPPDGAGALRRLDCSPRMASADRLECAVVRDELDLERFHAQTSLPSGPASSMLSFSSASVSSRARSLMLRRTASDPTITTMNGGEGVSRPVSAMSCAASRSPGRRSGELAAPPTVACAPHGNVRDPVALPEELR